MKIRQANFSDSEQVFKLLSELKRSGYAEMGIEFPGIEVTQEVRDMLNSCLERDDVYIVVAEAENKIVGLCVAYETPKIIEGRNRMLIEELVIDPEIRGKGVGSKLMESVEEIALQRKIKHIKVATGTKLRANEFYKKCGYTHFENAFRKEVSK